MARYRAYSDYRDSGIEWLSKVPSHWRLSPIKHLSRFSGGGTPSKDKPEYWNGDIPWVSPKDMKCSRITSTIDNVTELAVKQSSTNLLESGALLMVVRSGILQHSIPVAINDIPVTLNQDMKALKFNERMDVRYAIYVITGNQTLLLLEWGKQGATVESIEQEYLENTEFPVPTIAEQRKIANFLDHETAKIDTLIEKQQQLIKLLKEKRQAVISHAVTKGLNPNAPMRDSGVEWLGEVPEHWISMPLKLIVKTRKGVAFKSIDFCDQGVRVVKASDIKLLTIRTSDVFLPRDFLGNYPNAILKSGDIVLSTVGSNPDVRNSAVGQLGMVPDELDGTLLNQNTVAYEPDVSKVVREYLFYVLQMGGYRDHLDLHAHGTANQSSLSIEDMLNFNIVLPPLGEQLRICNYLTVQQEKLRILELRCRESAGLFQERRTALISAAVTGKIDVRDQA